MWEHRCSADNVNGSQCKRESRIATWCFAFQGERFESVTWVETCSHHSFHAQMIVATMDVHPVRSWHK